MSNFDNELRLFNAHLITYSSHPISHLGECLLVPSRAFLLDGLHDRKVALESIEGRDGSIVVTWAML